MEFVLQFFLILIGLLAIFWFVLRSFRKKSLWRYSYAKIDEIQFQRLGSLWSLHILVHYVYYVKGKAYRGVGEMRIEDILGSQPFLFSDRLGMPFLSTQNISLTGEEHIETYLMQLHPEIVIAVFSLWASKSKIPSKKVTKEHLFQDISIDFPWK